ncbi:MAG: type II secretion system F family protein [Acidobacteria bacterium]|jgi:type IV pilus assembly protein PilC|nr:MAG: type II secretion system F family protein [Acidobacteriota bacterium]PYV88620.1 MAG: type II secretion system F family protein [Acidobacteriota bacterium]
MAEFLVKIADERGNLAQQVEHGYSETEVRDRFAQQGYLVYWVKPRTVLSGGALRGRKVRQSQFVIFNQQFLTLIKAGLPILNSLDLLIKRQRDKNLQQLLQNVRERVKGGELLSDAFAAQHVFPKIYTTTLLAGEKSGNMEEVLSRYIAFQRLALTFKKKLAVSLVYPALLVSMVILMLVFLITYVVPQFAKLFENLNAQLPAITVFMLAVGTHAQAYGPYLLVAGVVAVILFWRWKASDHGAQAFDAVMLKLPVMGDIWLKYQVASFSRMLSTLLAGGLPLVPSLETAGASMSSRSILNGVVETAVRVREGQTLSGSLEKQKMFPDLAVEMIEVGESTGALPAMLNSVAEFYEEDVQTALGAAMALIEPVILIVMAVFVGGVLISLYLPIFSLGSGIH